jgi:hypothetical protein
MRIGFYGSRARQGAELVAKRARAAQVVEVKPDIGARELAANAPEVDCIVLETASVAPAIVPDMELLIRRSPGQSVVLVYGFARDEDLRRLTTAGIIIVRSPASAADLGRALDEARDKRSSLASLEQVLATSPETVEAGETPRFTAEELTQIGSISTSIDCECPHHLATVISNLRAFERYSADCANRDAKDAAMHEYLYRETLRANRIIENALRHLMDYEGIELAALSP